MTDTTEQKVWTAKEVKANMADDIRWVTRGVVAIYNKQTDAEQANQTTMENNGVGFNGVDAEFLSSIAQHIIKRNGHRAAGVIRQDTKSSDLSYKQKVWTRKKMVKYAGQLAKIANGEI